MEQISIRSNYICTKPIFESLSWFKRSRSDRLFVLSFENEDDRRSHSGYHVPKVEIKDYNAMINVKYIFDQTINNDTKTYENIRKFATGQGDDHTTDFVRLSLFQRKLSRLSSNMIGNSDDKTNFPHELVLTNRQVANLCKAFANNSSTDIKLSKNQLSTIIQSW